MFKHKKESEIFKKLAQYMFSSKGVFLSECPEGYGADLSNNLTQTEFSIVHHWHSGIIEDVPHHDVFIEMEEPYEKYEVFTKGSVEFKLNELQSRKGFHLEFVPIRDSGEMFQLRIMVTMLGVMKKRPQVRSIPEGIVVDATATSDSKWGAKGWSMPFYK